MIAVVFCTAILYFGGCVGFVIGWCTKARTLDDRHTARRVVSGTKGTE